MKLDNKVRFVLAVISGEMVVAKRSKVRVERTPMHLARSCIVSLYALVLFRLRC